MLLVTGEMIVDVGALEAVRDAIRVMETETLKEPGCFTYAFSVDVSDPTMMRITERWESMEALEAHFRTPHMAAFSEAIGRAKPKSMQVKLYEVSRELPLPGRSQS